MENSAYEIVPNSLNHDFFDEKNILDPDFKENDILNYEKKPYFFKKEKALVIELKERLSEFNLDEESKNEEQPNKEKAEKEVIQTTFLNNYSSSILLMIFDYFDPFSLNMIGSTCKYLQEISTHSNLYKKFCQLLFVRKSLLLPMESPFELLKNYIIKNRYEFPPLTLLKAQRDIRELIWGENYNDVFLTKGEFYKQFKNWRSCFLNAPKLRLKGVYVLKEKYIKSGEREFHETYVPVHVCEYFRYLRFFEDGKCIMIITSQKLAEEKIIKVFHKYLSKKNDVDTSEIFEPQSEKKSKKEIRGTILEGEYIKKEGTVHLIFCQEGSLVFEFQVLIKSSSIGMNDLLFLQEKFSRNLATNYIKNENDIRAESVKIFFFKKVKKFEEDIKNLQLRAVSM